MAVDAAFDVAAVIALVLALDMAAELPLVAACVEVFAIDVAAEQQDPAEQKDKKYHFPLRNRLFS